MSDARWPWRASLRTFQWTRSLLISKGTFGVKAFRNGVTLIVKSGDRQLSVAELLIVSIPTCIVVIPSIMRRSVTNSKTYITLIV
jgi:hypothetical protein